MDFQSASKSGLLSAMMEGHNVYQAGCIRMAGKKNRLIGRWMVLQSGGENSKPSATAAAKNLKASDFVTRVGRRKDLKSENESPTPSTTGKQTR